MESSLGITVRVAHNEEIYAIYQTMLTFYLLVGTFSFEKIGLDYTEAVSVYFGSVPFSSPALKPGRSLCRSSSRSCAFWGFASACKCQDQQKHGSPQLIS